MADSNGTDVNGHLYQTNLVANQAVIGSTGGVLTTLATANNAVFATNGSGVPSITATPTITSVTFPDSGGSGTTTSNTMAFYEQGTFTPTINGSTPGITTYSSQLGYYVKIGKLVFVQIQIGYSATTGTGDVVFGGLPFTIQNLTNGFGGGVSRTINVTYPAGTTRVTLEGVPGGTTFKIQASGTATASAYVQIENATRTWRPSFTYIST